MQTTIEKPTVQDQIETIVEKRFTAPRHNRVLEQHHGPNRHQRRKNAKVARTQAYRDQRNELKIEMNRAHRQRKARAFKMNIGGQFRRRGAA